MKKLSKDSYKTINGGMDNPTYTHTSYVCTDGINLMFCKKENGKITFYLDNDTLSGESVTSLITFKDSAIFDITMMCTGENEGYMTLEASEFPL